MFNLIFKKIILNKILSFLLLLISKLKSAHTPSQISQKKKARWLMPAMTIPLVLLILTTPFAMSSTYANRSEAPDHILTYTRAKLTWDNASGINADTGAAELSLFDARYDETVFAQNGDNLIAPGTEGFNIVRLKNDVKGTVKFTAVLYSISTDENIPVTIGLDSENVTDTDTYILPDGIDKSNVIRAVTGTIEGGRIQDFDISWIWNFYESDQQDITDTILGNKDMLDNLTVGFYIVVEDNNSYVLPESPDTGVNSHIVFHICLVFICGLVLLFLILGYKRDKQCEY